MDRRSRRPRSLRGLARRPRRSAKPETFGRLETRLLGLRSAPNAVLDPIFLATSDSIPGFRWALTTAATCLRVSTGNTARISRSPVW